METTFEQQKKQLIEKLERFGYIKNTKVKEAMLKVNREDFVSPDYKRDAYADTPLPIPGGQTVSAPHMHAILLSALKLNSSDKILEIGAGSGILLAYISELVGKNNKIIGIEINRETYEFAKKNLKRTGYLDKIKLVLCDGSLGLSEEAPYDKIVCSASCPEIPKSWIEQLKLGGIIVTPVGAAWKGQELIYLGKTKDGKLIKRNLGDVVFLELKGKYGWK